MSTHHTTDEIFSPAEALIPEDRATRFVDIHIYDYEPEPEEPPSIESQPEQKPATPDESDQRDTEPGRPHHKRYILAVCVSIMGVLLLGTLVLVYVLPQFTPDATITIVPNTQPVHTTQTITVTTGPTTETQLQGRMLSATTMTQARTVATTGKGHQDAKAAQGYITFYNAATSPQTVIAGTVVTGADGIKVVTEQDATIPAANYPTFGQISIPAQSVSAGPGGNIQAGDIYGPCCRLNVSAVNSAFSGGQQAQDYQTVTQHDITTVVSSLKTSLNQSVQAALQTQVQNNETLITPLPCQQNVKPDHQPGEEAAQITITVSETCIGMTYTTQVYQDRVTQIVNEQAIKQLGDGYTPIGQVQSTILQATAQMQTRTELHVTIAETYAYHINQQQQQQIKTLIAGETKTQATNTLLHIPGIQSVSVSNDTIPTDTHYIRVIVVYIG